MSGMAATRALAPENRKKGLPKKHGKRILLSNEMLLFKQKGISSHE